MSRKTICCILVLLAVGLTVWASGSAETTTSTQPEPKTLSIWHIFAVRSDGEPVVEQALEELQKKYPGLRVTESPMEDAAYKTKMRVAMSANDLPDIYLTWGGGWFKEFVDADLAVDITGWLADNPEVKDAFVPSAWSPVTFAGRTYGVACNGLGPVLTYYNTEIFDQYGLEPPETFTELKEVIRVLRSNGIIPFALTNNDKWPASLFYMYLVDRVGGSELFPSATFRTGGHFDDPAFVRAAELMQEMVKLGAFPEGVNGLKHSTGQDYMLFYSRKAAMLTMTASAWSHISEEAPEMTDIVDIFNFPMIEGGKGNPDNLIGSPGGNYFHVNPSAGSMDVAMDFLRNLSTEEAGKAIASIGRIPPQKTVDPEIEMARRIKAIFQKAENTQLYYDQFLPPELASYHLQSLQGIVDLSLSPRDMAREWEATAKKHYNE